EANEESLQPQYAECYFEEDYEVEEANRQQRQHFCWPPAEEDCHRTPTAAPLYIAPPETQHVAVKPLENPPPPPPGNTATCESCQCADKIEEQQQQQQPTTTTTISISMAKSFSSSVDQLVFVHSGGVAQHQQECESGSDSYTSTSTTTTTTSEEYQRMYAAQVQAYQMQQAYEQSGSEFDYHMDMEVAAMQQQGQLQLSSSHYSESGRRSAQECIETLVPPLSTYKLVDMVREVTPSPVPPETTQGSRHVVFLEDPVMKEVESKIMEEHQQQHQQELEEQVQHQQQQQQTTSSSTYASNLTQASKTTSSYATAASAKTSTKIDVHEVIEEVTDELEHSEVIFPPPSPISHLKSKSPSGLHRPETIPKYQRNWTVLPTQSPIRTPEPQELRENIPLAFVDTPKTPTTSSGSNGTTVHKPVAQMSTRIVSQQQQQQQSQHQQQLTTASAYSKSTKCEQRQQQLSSTVTSSTTSSAYAAGTCESTKQQLQLTKPTIPIIIEDRSGPVTMAFQALDEHMVRDQSQTPSRPYTPSMINKPAPITPYYQTPEKLCFDECPATHARDYDRRSASPFPDRAKSPAPGPPPNPLAAIRAPRLKESEVSSRVLQAGSITTGQSYLGAQQQAQQQERLISHAATGSQSAMQTFTVQPEKREQMQIGNMTVQRSEKASRLEEQKQSQMQSHTTTQVGNTQIERRRKVTEEFEHTSSAKTIEIRTGSQSSTTERRQSYGKTGFVANQARRLSGLEQEITNLTSQSQAISARAATLTETKFPELHSPGAGSNQNATSTTCTATATSSSSSATGSAPQGVCPVTGTYCRPGHTCCKQQQLESQQTNNNNNGSRPNASLGPVGFKPTQSAASSNITANAQAQAQSSVTAAAAAAQASAAKRASVSSVSASATMSSNANNNNNKTDDSAAGGMAPKGGAYSATSTPKRGRGILNKAVASGVRVPLCNSCGTHI
ncbi:hypothetical protein DOY81_006537, partial [Sarcophaga bullata]